MAASVLYASHAQRVNASRHGRESELSQRLIADANRGEAALAAYALSGDQEALAERDQAQTRLNSTLEEAGTLTGDAVEQAALRTQRELLEQIDASAGAALALPSAQRLASLRSTAEDRHQLLDRLATVNADFRSHQAAVDRREDARTALVAPLLIVILGIAFLGTAIVALRRTRREQDRRAQARDLQERFGEAMQVSDSQTEAHSLLKRHLERAIPGTSVTVLNRNNSADRLEASTAVGDGSPLAAVLEEARPRSCMAVRLSRPFQNGPESEEVLGCDVCGALGSASTCLPLLVGGEVIGAVLAEHDSQLEPTDADRIAQSVAQSAPVLANLRNLAIAETRAATDALTGLPNRRAVDDTLLRMLAQAGRSFNPLSVILLDLDRFKGINDTAGHDRGDEVLATFGTRLREVVRASDFAGRSGGEEFVLFLADTDRTGAVRVAEKVREVMRGIVVPGLERKITASFGIACFPDDGVDAAGLMRSADRALYAAKRGGRDRIEASSTGSLAPGEPRAVAADGAPSDR